MNASLTRWNICLAAAVAVAMMTAAACTRTAVAPRRVASTDTAVARVDGAPVWASDVQREAMAQGLADRSKPLVVTSTVFRQVLDELVDEKLLAAEAVRRGLDRDPATRRRLTAARDRVLGDRLLETEVAKTVTEVAVRGLYAQMRRTQGATTPDLEGARPGIIRFLSFDQVKNLVLDLRHRAKLDILVPPPLAPDPGAKR